MTSPTDAPALRYLLDTDPAPLHADDRGATVTVVAAAPTTAPVSCSRITIAFVPGDDPGDLGPNLDDVTPVVSPADTWKLTGRAPTGVFTFEPTAAHPVLVPPTGHAFQFPGVTVNTAAGVTPVTVTDTVLLLGKYPRGFRLDSLRPATLDATGRASVQPDEAFQLTWNATAAPALSYQLLHDDTAVDVTALRTWPPTPDPTVQLDHDTTFYLRARLTTGEHTVDHVISTTVQVTTAGPSRLIEAYTARIGGGEYTGMDTSAALLVDGGAQIRGLTEIMSPGELKIQDLRTSGTLRPAMADFFSHMEILWELTDDELFRPGNNSVQSAAFEPVATDALVFGACSLGDSHPADNAFGHITFQLEPYEEQDWDRFRTEARVSAKNGVHAQSFLTVVPRSAGFTVTYERERECAEMDRSRAPTFYWIPFGDGSACLPTRQK